MAKTKQTTLEGVTEKGNTWQTTVRGTDKDVAETRAAFAAGGSGTVIVDSVEVDD